MLKHDCDMFRHSSGAPVCSALEELLCRGGVCPFYKTASEARLARLRSFERRQMRGGPFTACDQPYLHEARYS